LHQVLLERQQPLTIRLEGVRVHHYVSSCRRHRYYLTLLTQSRYFLVLA
jgi:hypothetical protein